MHQMKGNLDKIIPYAPTLHPSETEFKDFKKFIYKIQKIESIRKAGCVKVNSKDCASKILQI